MMIYSARVIKSKMEDLIEDGFTNVNFIELMEAIGFEIRDVKNLLETYSDLDERKL